MAFYDAGASSKFGPKAQPEGEMDALLLGVTRELVASTPSQRNYKGILIALLVICAICGLILFAIYLLRPPDDGPRVKGRKVTLADTISKHFVVQPFNGTWLSAQEILFRDSRGGISVFNAASLESQIFLSNTTFRQLNANRFAVSPDQQFVLFTHDVRPIWEHSSLAKYTLYDIHNEFKLALSPFEERSRDAEQIQLQHAEWGPNGNAIILVYRNDIYYKAALNNSRMTRITTTGRPGIIFNGVPDWIYEVTVLKTHKTIWVSPNGKFLLFACFNDSMVGEVSYQWYGEASAYPQLRRIRYPKAGTTNPEVTLWVVNLEPSNGVLRPVLIKFPSVVDSRDHYLVSVQWIDDREFSVVWVNRQQTGAVFSTCNSANWTCKTIYSLNPTGIGWLDFPHAPIFSKSREKCLLRVPVRDGEAGYFHQVVWLDINTGKVVPVTNGPLEVTQISAWDQFNHLIYFIGIPPKKAGERHLYKVPEAGSNIVPVCMTCPTPTNETKTKTKELKGNNLQTDKVYKFPMSPNSENRTGEPPPDGEPEEEPEVCLYNHAIFNPTQEFFVRECQGPGFPTTTLHQAPSGQLAYVMNPNSHLKEQIANLGLPVVKTFQVEVSGGNLATARLYLPAGFREGEEFKFPLVLHLDGFPGSQLVSEKWRLTWASYLTSHKNFIVAEIDGRGSGYGGENARQPLHGNFGSVQVTDQLEVIKYLRDNISFIDERNLAVYGTGYGGYLTLLMLAHDTNDLFRCGIAIAPITKWEFYNSVHTERFFGLPNMTENSKGYEDGDIIGVVKELRGKKFMVVHGTADEKIHYQHTLHLTKALIKEGVSFNEQVYPDEGHEFLGVQEHFYNTMESYMDSNFDVPDWEDWEKANFLGIRI